MSDQALAIFHGLKLWLLVLLAWLALWRGLKSVFVVEFRAELFELRRQLFRLVAGERIPPNHRVYARMRGLLNGLLARAEYITPLNVIMLLAAASVYAPKVVRTTMAEIRAIPDVELRRELAQIHAAVDASILRHVRRFIVVSPLFWIAIPIVRVMGMWQMLSKVIEAPATPHISEEQRQALAA